MLNPHLDDLNEAMNNARIGYAQSAIESCQRVIDSTGVALRTQARQTINSLQLYGDLGVIDDYASAIALIMIAKTLLNQNQGVNTVAAIALLAIATEKTNKYYNAQAKRKTFKKLA
jgi:hypothetical protein